MLKNISLNNFKGFKCLDHLNVKPITVLCGPNSCGKSSILQSILLMKQTLESQIPNQILLLNGRFVHLGSFENILYQKNDNNKMSFEFIFTVTREDMLNKKGGHFLPLVLLFREILSKENYSNKNAEHNVKLRVVLKPVNEPSEKTLGIIVDCLECIIETVSNNSVSLDGKYCMQLIDNESYKISWESNSRILEAQNKISEIESKLKFANLFPISFGSYSKEEGKKQEISFIFYELSEIFKILFSSFSYLGPLREEPSRRYIYEDEVVEVGIKGEFAAYLYNSEREKIITDHYFYNKDTDNFEKVERINLSEAIKRWLNLLNINDMEPSLRKDIIYLELDAGGASGTRVSIADVGFGVSQIFPIVLEGLRVEKGNCLLLEQPEIHLHPNLQMQLADYFIALALSKRNVIVETHSDHIINRLVRRIVEDETNEISKLVGIYFIKPTEKGSIFEEICIDETKGITNWPYDFFDQTATEQEKIIRAGLKKRSREVK
ncbi:MAG: AAA family ATPase [bacterium]|nr:AAA family ATPase [bacterium]